MKKFPVFLFSLTFSFCYALLPIESLSAENKNSTYWRKILKKKPNSNLVLFNYAVSLHKERNHKKAISIYRKVAKSKSKLSPIAKFYSAKALLSINKKESAKKQLTKINLENLPKNLKKKVLALKNKLFAEEIANSKEESKKRKHFFNIGVNLGGNSNPQFTADSSSTDTESDRYSQLTLAWYYKAIYEKNYDFSISHSSNFTNYNTETTYNYDYHKLSGIYSFYKNKTRYRIIPAYAFQTYGDEDYSNTYSLELQIKKKLRTGYFSMGYQIENINMLNTTYDYLAGHAFKPYLGWEQYFGKYYFTSTYSYQDNELQDSSTNSPSYIDNSIQFGIGKKAKSYTWKATFGIDKRVYAFDQTENDTRKDTRSWLSAYLDYIYSGSLSFITNVYFLQNSSNFDTSNTNDKNYKQGIFSLGAKYYF